MRAIEEIVKDLNAANELVWSLEKGTDEYVDARMTRAELNAEYDQAMNARRRSYTATIGLA